MSLTVGWVNVTPFSENVGTQTTPAIAHSNRRGCGDWCSFISFLFADYIYFLFFLQIKYTFWTKINLKVNIKTSPLLLGVSTSIQWTLVIFHNMWIHGATGLQQLIKHWRNENCSLNQRSNQAKWNDIFVYINVEPVLGTVIVWHPNDKIQ